VKYTPAGHLVLIKRDDIVKQTKSGILIATDEKLEKAAMNRGLVLDLGPTCWCAEWLGGGKTPWCKVGDKVAFAKYAGTTYVDEETKEEFLLIRDEDVIMVIEE
jgi:co-chaperonin GroES (HSP10)